MSVQKTSWHSSNAISLRGSVSGLTHSDPQDGLTTGPSGPEVALASLSPRQAQQKGLLTSGTFGRTSTGSSRSAALQSCLASRLQARTASLGSTLYKLTWKERTTPSGRSISALRASARRTSDSDCSGWVTPTTRDWKDTPGMATKAEGRNRLDQLPRQAAQCAVFGRTQTGLSSEIPKSARLNPALPRWLMGIPRSWDDCAPTETPS